MADKNASKSVMGNLPSTRPPRIGGRRENRDGGAAKPRAASATATEAKPKRTSSAPKKRAASASRAKPAASKPAAAKPAASKPRAVRSGSPALKAARQQRTPPRRPQTTPPKGTELVTTAVQAAGELAQIGLTLGGRAVKRAVKKLPKP